MVRVRFAPSPTGALHIGGVRTALYNYLFAKKMGGKMLLRIEDTDQTRFVPGAEAYIMEALSWVGIKIDEGQGAGGPHAPYRQSERSDLYKKYVQELVAADKAYYAFDTPEELDKLRAEFEAKGSAFQYNAATRPSLRNSLSLAADEVEQLLANGTPSVIRLKVPAKEEIRFKDLIRDWVTVHSSTLDDKVLMKADGLPTYHLANVVDDHLMEISHVIRGEEWLPSAPIHVLLYKCFGWTDTMPEFAHLPLLFKPEGNGKLSKRDADLGGFPVFPLEWNVNETKSMGFREEGYLPEALINFLAFLGWNPGTEQELFSMDELVEAFSLDRISKSGAKFDIHKAQWFNQQYLRQTDNSILAKDLHASFEKAGLSYPETTCVALVELLKERVNFAKEIVDEAQFMWQAPTNFTEEAKAKLSNEALEILENFASKLESVAAENDGYKHLLGELCTEAGQKIGKMMPSLRVALTGATSGPDLMKIVELLGAQEVAKRLAFAKTN
jgi:glutamyl-tRNA synthetase